MNGILKGAVLALSLAVSCGCATAQNPKVRLVQNAITTVDVLGTVGDATIGAAEQGWITTAQAHQALDVIKAAMLTIDASPDGGYAVALSAVTQLETALPAPVLARLGPYLRTARAALEVIHER